jgi:ABC-type sugar transport system permease subunit
MIWPEKISKQKGVRLRGLKVKKVAPRKLLGILFILPATLVLATTIVYPLLSIFIYSVQARGASSTARLGSFIGLENFRTVLRYGDFTTALTRSVVVTFISVTLTVIFGMIVALMLNGQFPGRGIARSVLILPWAMPTFAAAFAWRWMLDYNYGSINLILQFAHLSRAPILFFSKDTALLTASLIYTWKGLPWAAMVFLAGLQVIPQELRDAARVDGASAWQEWWRIVLPSLHFIVQITVILLVVWNFNWFDMMWLLTDGGPGRATTVLPIDVFLQAFRAFDLGSASALGVIILIILLAITLVMFRVRAREETGL